MKLNYNQQINSLNSWDAQKAYALSSLGAKADNAPAPSGPDSISYHVHVLAELAKRMDERVEALRSLADFVVGAEPIGGPKVDLKPVSSGMAAELCERVAAVDMRINALAHEYGRLERAIRG